MSRTSVVESLENRRFYSGTVAARAAATAGPSAGNHAAAATVKAPYFTTLLTDAQDPTDTSNTNAARNTAIKLSFARATGHGGIDNTKLTRQAIQITDLNTGTVYNSANGGISKILQKVTTSGGGDVLIISPKATWAKNTTYKVEVNGSFATGTNRLQDVNGTQFAYYGSKTTTFRTGSYLPVASLSTKSGVNFTQQVQSQAGSRAYTATVVGPDHKLYAATRDGYIYRFTIAKDGSLRANGTINAVRDHFGGNRLITGITFTPASTATNLELWVSSGQYRFGNTPGGSYDVQKYADNFTGAISSLSGSDLTTSSLRDLIVNIPRSVKDHTNNQIVFAPNGKTAYFCVAAMNAMGAPDATWGDRPENIYSAAILRVRIGGEFGIGRWINRSGPVNLSIDGGNNATGLNGGTHYNIYKGTNPVRLYADGIRNAFDMVFANNGRLYASVNGSSAGGNVPATPKNSRDVPLKNRLDQGKFKDKRGNPAPTTTQSVALSNVQQIEQDTLLDVQEGAYYGHPNPSRGEYILAGGNPTRKADKFEFSAYPVGTAPDRNYMLPAYDFGKNQSPDGILQYKAVGKNNAALNGYLLVTRYSSGADIVALPINKDGTIGTAQERINGFTELGTPLDIAEDNTTGNLYVTTLSGDTGPGSIVLLKAAGTTKSVAKSVVKSLASSPASPISAAKSVVSRPVAASVFSDRRLVKELDLDV